LAFSIVVIDDKDNVGVALTDIPAGDAISLPDGSSLVVTSDVPYSHKVALRPIPCGEPVIKYGEVIGVAAREIDAGEWVHTHNLEAQEAGT
jgi:predicted RecA/RadA family phage recombinase